MSPFESSRLRDGTHGFARRPDGLLKVTGAARYTTDQQVPEMAYAVLVESTIASGRVTSLGADVIAAADGVLAVLTSENIRAIRGSEPPQWPDEPEELVLRPDAGAALTLADDIVRYAGQPIAVVVAETLEVATAAANSLEVSYQTAAPILGLEAHNAEAQPPRSGQIPGGDPADSERGDVKNALATADTITRATYRSPTAHQNSMEPCATLAHWVGDQLVVHDSNQGPHIIRNALAAALGFPIERVRVLTEFVGGGFGGKLQLWPHGYLAALAAKMVRRPVKLVLTRRQMFGSVGHRPELVQDITLGASIDGRLQAIEHSAVMESAIINEFVEGSVTRARHRYACPNVATSTKLVHLNVSPATSMRAPGKSTGSFALESAMDELAWRLHMDPIELRVTNFAAADPENKRPWSSTHLLECYRAGAQHFGWRVGNERAPRREGPWLIGQGMASANYPRYASQASARVRMRQSGKAVVETGVAEIGTGNPSVLPRIAADALGLPLQNVSLQFGDTDLPFAPQAGGSRIVASVGAAILLACDDLKARLSQWGAVHEDDSDSPLLANLARSGLSEIVGEGTWAPTDADAVYSVETNAAHFCEVAVDPELGLLRLRRFVTVVDGGQILSPMTARSQVVGAVVMGIGQALMEETVLDERFGRFINRDLAEYLVPVHADIPDIDVIFVGGPDPNAGVFGAKSLGEIGTVGTAAAIANAVFDATGQRIRDLPLRLDRLNSTPQEKRAPLSALHELL